MYGFENNIRHVYQVAAKFTKLAHQDVISSTFFLLVSINLFTDVSEQTLLKCS